MQKKKANLSLIFAIIAVALNALYILWSQLATYGYPSYILFRFILVATFVGVIVAFIVPVFVAIGRKAPGARKAFTIITFIFLGFQFLFAVFLLVHEITGLPYGWATWFSWLLNLANGDGVFSGLVTLFRTRGMLYILINFLFVAGEVFFILKNVFGAMDLCRRERSAAPAQPYYAPQNAQQQYAAPAGPKFCPKCGAPAEGFGAFCGKCGAPIGK